MLENEEVSNEIETESQTEESSSQEEQVAPTPEPEKEAASESADEAVEAAVKEEVEAQAFKPNVKFKANEKEMEIPKEYHSLMKDAASEKAVKELFEKAYGLDSVKQKLVNTRQEREQLLQETQGYKQAIGKARNIYQSAVQTGNWHKMDDFFKSLGVSPDHVMSYAIEKAKLHEMEPNQRKLIEAKLQAERDYESEQESRMGFQEQIQKQAQELKRVQFETFMSRQDVQSFEQKLDSAFSKPGLFRQEIIAAGEQAWFSEGRDIPVDEAIKRVIGKYGLTAQMPSNATQVAPTQVPSGKKVIQKAASTIPNVSGSNGSSPLSSQKPKSLDDIKKLRDRALAGEQV
jgi:hypothetical protein